MSKLSASESSRPWRGDAYWQYEMEGILLDFGVEGFPDLGTPNDETSRRRLIATRVRRKYVVRRIRVLMKEYVGTQLDEKVHDFLDQARLRTDGAYWRELDQEFHTRRVFML